MFDLANHNESSRGATRGGARRGPLTSLPVGLTPRQTAAVFAIVAVSAAWFAVLCDRRLAAGAAPWYATLAILSAAAVAWWLSMRRARPVVQVSAGERRPLSSVESYALTYALFSLAMGGWIVFHMLVPSPPSVREQVVDIELSGLSDYKDNRSLLPSSDDLDAVKKTVTSETSSIQGAVAAAPSARAPLPLPAAGPRTAERKLQPKATSQAATRQPAGGDQQLHGRAEPAVRSVTSADIPRQGRQGPELRPQPPAETSSERPLARISTYDNQPFMEEVAPPELLELVDNDGDDGTKVWQAGGRSTGGTGARSDLATYLKELNRRIKRAWTPPRGTTRKAEVIFRIERQGRLVSLRVVRSSGDAAADEAAMRAVVSSAPFAELPSDYPHSYLDVRYGFNYSFDQMREVTSTSAGQWQ